MVISGILLGGQAEFPKAEVGVEEAGCGQIPWQSAADGNGIRGSVWLRVGHGFRDCNSYLNLVGYESDTCALKKNWKIYKNTKENNWGPQSFQHFIVFPSRLSFNLYKHFLKTAFWFWQLEYILLVQIWKILKSVKKKIKITSDLT